MGRLGLGHEFVAQLWFELHRENRFFRHGRPPATVDTNQVYMFSLPTDKLPIEGQEPVQTITSECAPAGEVPAARERILERAGQALFSARPGDARTRVAC